MAAARRPAKRRQYGTGSVSQRKDGLWIGRIEAGSTPSGGRRRITVSGRTEAECKARLLERRRQIDSDGVPAAGTSRTTVKAWAQEWLPIYRNEVKPRVYATNASLVTKWIVPAIGHARLADLSPRDVRAVHKAVTGAGRSSTTAHHASVLLHRMLKAAVLDGHRVPANVFEVKHPPLSANDRDAIPTDDARRLLAVARSRPDYARWLAPLLNGMRRGEILGLTWDCVDFEKRTLDVSWQLQLLPYADKRDRSKGFEIPPKYEARQLVGAAHLLRPKSKKSRRVIPLVPWLHGELLAAREEWTPNPWGLVWASINAKGEPIPHRFTDNTAMWRAIQQEAGVAHPSGRPYHLHEARHTTATLLLEEGVDQAVRMAIMGHSSIEATRGYQHLSQDLSRAAVAAVAARLTPSGDAPEIASPSEP
ncbi:tyrosine-type recombinase/integrase [Terrabacter terrigena]|uniref:Tyrosine-type recombinase/integrase n=1 Tax=Terrabacter terrigena TaxID=574718 RepID=A0ABW3N108_9MICO